MTTKLAYDCYKHTIRSAYQSLDLIHDISNIGLSMFEYHEIEKLNRGELLAFCLQRIKLRLSIVSNTLLSELLDQPQSRLVYLNNKEVFIPLLNKQAVEWYGNSSIFNFDFILESFHGMHKGARTIYDIGGHQGFGPPITQPSWVNKVVYTPLNLQF